MTTRPLVMALIAVVAFVGFLLLRRDPAGMGGVPAATWRVGGGADVRQPRNYDELAPESPLRLSFACDEPRHVYVFGRSEEDGTLRMFPAAEMKGSPANPLPPGKHVLPGEHEGAELRWTTRSQIVTTTVYVVVAAREPVAELEALLPRLRHWSTTVLPDGSLQVTKPAGDDWTGRPHEPWPSPLLRRAAELGANETVIHGPLHADAALPGVWTSSFAVKEKKDPPAAAGK